MDHYKHAFVKSRSNHTVRNNDLSLEIKKFDAPRFIAYHSLITCNQNVRCLEILTPSSKAELQIRSSELTALPPASAVLYV